MAAGEQGDGCMRQAGRDDETRQPRVKSAAGISIFLLEELGDARLRHAQLKKYIDEAITLIEKSPERDHFFEVAGHLLHGIPECLLKMGKALDAAALAAARLDYEEIKGDLRPEKVEELEKALEEVRIRQLRRRSDDTPGGENIAGKDQDTMNGKTAAQELLQMAEATEASGQVPVAHLISLVARLENGQRTASVPGPKAAEYLRSLAAKMDEPNPSRLMLAQHLRRILADAMPMTSAQVAAAIYQQANSREDVMKGFAKANPSMTDEQLEKAADMWEKHKDVVKDQH